MKREDEIRLESYRDREMKSRRRRERELRKAKFILMNAAIALVVILVVFVIAIAKLNGKNNNIDTKNVNEKKISEKSKTNKEKAKKDKTIATPTAVPSKNETESLGDGTKKWIRTNLDPNKPMIALSFDDGPYPPVTEKILKVLKKYDSRATFFVVGNRIQTYKDVIKKSYDMGNQIGSHTYDHEDLSKMTRKQLLAEMAKTNKELQNVIGCHATLIRPPYGNINNLMRKTIKIPMMYWSIDTDDWKWRNVSKVLSECRNVKDGDIILMHDLYSSTAQAVKKLVPRLVNKGYQLVTIDEMFYYKGIDAKAGKVYASGR